MAFWRLFYHIVWATKGREPLITQELEAELYGYLRGKRISWAQSFTPSVALMIMCTLWHQSLPSWPSPISFAT